MIAYRRGRPAFAPLPDNPGVQQAAAATGSRAEPLIVRDMPTRVMGVLNATPDSFSGDGLLEDMEGLLQRGLSQVAEGATILDVGGESTRPGASPVTQAEELRRVLPLVKRLAERTDAAISIDTMKAEVADRALAAGARILNDVSGLREPELASVAAAHGAWIVLTHNRWTARASADRLGGYYAEGGTGDVLEEVARGLLWLADEARAAGVAADRIVLDPGLGFGKTPRESLELVKRTAELRECVSPYPVLIGPSRKGFVGRALGLSVDDRLEGTLACVALAARDGVEVVRVHDVRPALRAARMAWAIRQGMAAELLEPDARS